MFLIAGLVAKNSQVYVQEPVSVGNMGWVMPVHSRFCLTHTGNPISYRNLPPNRFF